MILVWLIIILLAGGFLAWLAGRVNDVWPRWISLVALAVDAVLVLVFWSQHYSGIALTTHGPWLVELLPKREWIPQLGISFHLAMDGLSLLLVALTLFLGILSVACSWTEIRERVGFFHFNLMWILAGITGVFLALDLFLFYFFWELMLVPMYFLISIWGHENRIYASYKFFIFTQASGLLMFVAILGLYFIHGRATGVYTFDYAQLLGTPMQPSTAMWLMLGFFVAFAVKLPAVPMHTWLPDAHTEAPTAGSVILAGLLLKTGAYALLRFAFPLFPTASRLFVPLLLVLGLGGLFYASWIALAQKDIKRLVAYSSIGHMGLVVVGVAVWNVMTLSGAILQMVNHGLTTSALFILVGMLDERVHSREMAHFGGLWKKMPAFSAFFLLFAMSSLGLPGPHYFVGEILILIGTF